MAKGFLQLLFTDYGSGGLFRAFRNGVCIYEGSEVSFETLAELLAVGTSKEGEVDFEWYTNSGFIGGRITGVGIPSEVKR
jgi:hypothetical protein